jgi:hypothetical protein
MATNPEKFVCYKKLDEDSISEHQGVINDELFGDDNAIICYDNGIFIASIDNIAIIAHKDISMCADISISITAVRDISIKTLIQNILIEAAANVNIKGKIIFLN